jgi:hypothetical protein
LALDRLIADDAKVGYDWQMSEHTKRRARLKTVEIVLNWAWDPIGVGGVEEVKDEYDSYALPVLGMLERFAADEEVSNYLTSIEVDLMGLKASIDKNANIAAMLRELHAIDRADSDGS